MTATLAAVDKMPTIVAGDQFPIDRMILNGGEELIRELRYFSHLDREESEVCSVKCLQGLCG